MSLEETAKKLMEKSAKEMTDRQVKAFRMGVAWLIYKIRAESTGEYTMKGEEESLVFKVKAEWLNDILD